ncbi:MAG: glycine betaine ABC transporter substrate-binding protein [Victivallales bacterium]|nr:glycine betaine ABC transporter substrate-binding protein [Victivallales bacterium]
MTKRLTLFLIFFLTVLFIFFSGCKKDDKGGAGKKNSRKGVLTILYPNWAEGIALTNLAEIALEDKGYSTEIKPIEPGPIYASLAEGDCDLFLDAWLPHTHKHYWKKYGKHIDRIGESFSNGRTGLVVPDYVKENSITDLKSRKVAEKYNNKIIGIGSGAGIHNNTTKAIKEYKIPFRQITSSGPAMIACLKKAYDDREPVIITGWKPHFMWARFNIKFLKDPKGIYPKDVIATLSRKGFREEYPEITSFFEKFNFTEKQLNSLMDAVGKADDPADGAEKWYNKNKQLIKSWW